MSVEVLWNDFNVYRLHTQRVSAMAARGIGPQWLKWTKAREKALGAMLHWCSEKGIDARQWLYSLFQARRWLAAPQFNQLISPKHLARYAGLNTQQQSLYTRQTVHSAPEAANKGYDPNIHISAAVEALKANHITLGGAPECMADIQNTLGYHPKSSHCSACHQAQACTQALQSIVNFDIQALRRGELSKESAIILAAKK